MAKRTRGSIRPGQRRPSARPSVRPTAGRDRALPDEQPLVVRPSGSLTAEEEARAAEIEAQIRAEERAAEEAQRRGRERPRAGDVTAPRAREAAPLAVRASAEYAYVRRDILRIAGIGGLMLAVLLVLHVLINVMGVIRV